MKKLLAFILTAAVILTMSIPVALAASGIHIDGEFDDWDGKAVIASPAEDYLTATKWDSDKNNLYLLFQAATTTTPSKLTSEAHIDTEFGRLTLSLNYNYKAEKVDVTLEDASGKKLYSKTFRSGNYKKDDSRACEISIPLSKLCSTPAAGYAFTIVTPNGSVKISTASTTGLPVYLLPVVLIALAFAGGFWASAGMKKKGCMA